VEALLPLTQGGLRSGRTQQLAKDAIEEIQARFVQADAGQLSLIDSSPREGALSLEAERGGLALTPTSSETLD
jgi:hypothetical protein